MWSNSPFLPTPLTYVPTNVLTYSVDRYRNSPWCWILLCMWTSRSIRIDWISMGYFITFLCTGLSPSPHVLLLSFMVGTNHGKNFLVRFLIMKKVYIIWSHELIQKLDFLWFFLLSWWFFSCVSWNSHFRVIIKNNYSSYMWLFWRIPWSFMMKYIHF